MPRTWKSALAPYLAGIPERVGFFGEGRFLLVNAMRFGERRLERIIDRCAMLALPKEAALPDAWPPPQLAVPPSEVAAWRERNGIAEHGPVVALCPGAVGPSKRWPVAHYAALSRRLAAEGFAVWVLGSPAESPLAREIAQAGGGEVRDLTGPDLRNAILALKGARVAVSNDSGLMHVAAALGTPTIAIFGPTIPRLWAPLNPLAAVIESSTPPECRPCHKPTCRMGHHRCMREIPPEQVARAVRSALTAAAIPAIG
jgi:heptosyltransferase-2